MKIFIFISLIIFCPLIGKTDCGSWYLNTFPSSQEIHKNSIFLLEEYSGHKFILQAFSYKTKIYLQADNHYISLKVVDSCKGMFDLFQVILKPDEELHKGSKYYLKIEGLKNCEKAFIPTKWNSETFQKERIYWTVTKNSNFEKPQWSKPPRYKNPDIQYYGCGPAVNSIFNFEAQSKSSIFIKTEFYDITQDKVFSFYLSICEDGLYCKREILEVGHGMCAGAFKYLEKHQYKIRFKLIDMSGNETNKWTNWVNVKNPMDNYGEH